MNQEIIARWNSMVGKDDVVFHLGDVGRNCDDLVTQLNGKIIYVKGGHDHGLTAPMIREIRIQGMRDEYGNDRIIVLCHYSMRSWKNSHYASYMLYGHHHGRLESWGLSFDVGQDTHNFYPYSLKEVEEKMKTLKPIVDFRKKP
jgi:calcineurin-like phosphoesterase family protein